MTVELPYGRKRALEIATTLATDPELMLLDEPTQGMGHEDVERVSQLIKTVSAEPHRADGRAQHERRGGHRRHDHACCSAGRSSPKAPYAEVSKNPQVIEAYMGSAEDWR